jgi:hypothetical protein
MGEVAINVRDREDLLDRLDDSSSDILAEDNSRF